MSHRLGVVRLLLPRETSQRALQETIADWRDERGRATSAVGRVGVDLAGVTSVLRVIAITASADLFRPDAWRLASRMFLVAIVVALINPTGWAYVFGTLRAMPLADAARIALFLLPSSLTTAFILVCAAGAGQRRDSATPTLAAMIVSCAFMLALLGWVTPASNRAFHTEVWQITSEAVPAGVASRGPTRGPAEQTLPQLLENARSSDPSVATLARRTLAMRTALFLAVPTAFLLGAALRTRFGRRGSWRIAQASGAFALVGVIVGTDVLTGVLLRMLEWPTRELVSRFNPELWLALAVAWVAIALLVRTPEPRKPGTSEPEPTASQV